MKFNKDSYGLGRFNARLEKSTFLRKSTTRELKRSRSVGEMYMGVRDWSEELEVEPAAEQLGRTTWCDI